MLLYIRSFFFYLGYWLATILFGVVSLFLPLFPKKISRPIILCWIYFVLFWLRCCCGIRYKVSGYTEALSTPAVIAANHQSNWETFFFQSHFKPLSTILKEELLKIPFFGWGLKLLEPVAIDRGNPIQALKKIKQQGLVRLQSGYHLLVFPEGTRRPVNELGDYKRSAADIAQEAGVLLLPIAHNSGEFWVNKRFIKLPGCVDIVIGEPINVNDKSTKVVMKEVQQWTQEQLIKIKERKSTRESKS